MAANIPDLGAVAHLGGQFQHNVFDTIQKKAHEKGKKTAQAQAKQAQANQNARNAYAQSAAQAVKQGRQQFAKNQQAQQKQAQQAAKAHAQGVKSGRVAPAPGAPPRTFAMGSTPQQKAQAKATAQAAKTMQQQRNYAHGEALGMQRQMDRAAAASNALNARHAATIQTHAQKANINLNLAQQKHQASVEAHAVKAATSINALAQKQQMQQSHQSAMAAGKQKAFDIAGAQKLELQSYVNKQKLQHQAAMHAQRQSQKTVKPAKASSTSGKATTVQPSLTPSFSSSPATHTPVKATGPAPTNFSSQLVPQKPVAKPQGTATASFSSGPTPAKPAPKPVPQMGVTGQQFSDVSPKANDPYPTHVHPAGSSSATLPKLTASQPKPNEFTVGSRNAKPGGIAARGSQLEAWAIGRQAEIRKQRGSDNTQLRLGDQSLSFTFRVLFSLSWYTWKQKQNPGVFYEEM